MKNQPRRLKPGKLIFIGLLSSVLASASVSWAQIVVTTLADSGPGSLRQAIIDANTNGGPDVITFVPGLAGIILLQTPLSNLTGTGDTIDGTGAGVVLDGSALVAGSIGLNVRRSNYTIRGLTIQNMPGDGIRVQAPFPPSPVLTVTGVVIDGNKLIGNGSQGIRVSGGIGPGKRVDATLTNNTITDSDRAGILVSGNLDPMDDTDAGGNTVTALVDGNTVNRSRAGALNDPNFGGDGIDIVGGIAKGSNNTVTATVSNNVVMHNRDDGIVAVGCGLNASGKNNSVSVRIINNQVKDNPCNLNAKGQGLMCLPPELETNTGIVVSGASREVAIGGGEESSTCQDNTVVFEISGNTVLRNRSQNISVTGGPGTGHDLQGIVTGNSANDSPEGDGISISGGRGTGTKVHDVTVSNNQVNGNFNRGIIISGGTGTINAVLTSIDVLSNSVRSSGENNPSCAGGCQGILVTGGNLSQNAIISDVLIDGNMSNNNLSRGIIVTRGQNLSAFLPLISLAGVTNNTATDNIDDGILIASSIPGSGATPVSGNRADRNGVDGIDLNSTGYVVSNNTASRNTVDGINLGGNTNGGGNVARNNGSCNTPLPASCQ
jgi:Right handed beta helix region